MKSLGINITKMNVLYYLLGFFTLGLGVNMMLASTLGNGAWDTVTINMRSFFNMNIGWEWVTIGMVSWLVSIIIFIIVMSYRRQPRLFFMLVPIVLVGLFIDFWDILIFQGRIAEVLWLQLIFYIIGTFILPLGLTLIVKSSFPAFVFDELMLMFVDITKAKKITYVRLVIEVVGISIGTVFGFLAFWHVNQTLGVVNIGSVIFTFTISPIMAMWFKVLKVKRNG